MSKILIALDDGHGMKTRGKRTPPIAELNGRVIFENEFNREVVKLVDIELKHNGFETLLTAPTDEDVPLSERTNLANSKKANLLISFHFNAFTGRFETSKAEGFSVHVHSRNGESAKIGDIVLKHLSQGTKQKNRGLVVQNLHMTRETKMPAILIEFGFMDNKREAMLMIDRAFQKECAQEVAKAVCEYYKVKYSQASNSTSPPSTPAKVDTTKGIGLVKIVTQGLSLRKGASFNSELERELNKDEQYYAYEQKGMWYNLGAGLWVSEGSAKNHLIFTPHPKEAEKPQPPTQPSVTDKNPIMGISVLTPTQMISFVKEKNSNAQNIGEIASLFIEVGNKYGIRGDIAFCQSIIETGWFKFDGGTAVTYDQHNYCGMGVTKKGMKGNSFPTVKDGVTAQIQHLFAYASKDELPIGEELLDPRFKYVTRGIAPNWEDLSMRWAMNANYGKHIIEIYNSILETPFIDTPSPSTPNSEELIELVKNSFEIQQLVVKLWEEINKKYYNSKK